MRRLDLVALHHRELVPRTRRDDTDHQLVAVDRPACSPHTQGRHREEAPPATSAEVESPALPAPRLCWQRPTVIDARCS